MRRPGPRWTVNEKAAAINKGGTPIFAMMITGLCAIVLSSIGTFEKNDSSRNRTCTKSLSPSPR
jgi:hypothetical protein